MSPISSSTPVIAADTTVGAVALTVTDLGRARAFYEGVLGLRARALPGGDLALEVGDGEPLVVLHESPAAPARDPRAPGLFHLALRFASRRDLAHALLRVADARWPLSGASDHLVSEALYLSDPDGNGIELYRDRPREQWTRDAAGELQMATLALDLHDLLTAAGDVAAPERHAPAGTSMGHVHLQVSDVDQAEAFYHGVLGFEVVVRSYPGARFVAAGGYHHHLGLNTWNSAGSPPPAPGAVGLQWFEIVVPDAEELARIRARVSDAGLAAETGPAGNDALTIRDPSGSVVRFRAA